MPELRIILAVAGVLFIAAIAGFEWWRARRQGGPTAAREDYAPTPSPTPSPRGVTPLPEINVVRESRMAPSNHLPVIELESTSASGTRRALGISISDEVAVDVPNETPAAGAPSPVPTPTRHEPYIGQHDEISQVRVIEEPEAPPSPQLVLRWPGEAERRIVALRVTPAREPRFAGRALRQAFASTGFWHGPLDIFHLPDETGRVILSAAALAQPGTFDPSIMDSQRFSGLNLFAVLPGPLPERETFDELVHAARSLAERLDGTLCDQHGEELSPPRIARLRQALAAPPEVSPPSAAGIT